jgi:hypothetical protein
MLCALFVLEVKAEKNQWAFSLKICLKVTKHIFLLLFEVIVSNKDVIIYFCYAVMCYFSRPLFPSSYYKLFVAYDFRHPRHLSTTTMGIHNNFLPLTHLPMAHTLAMATTNSSGLLVHLGSSHLLRCSVSQGFEVKTLLTCSSFRLLSWSLIMITCSR